MTRERVVFDTNVLISGALSASSTPAAALEWVVTHDQLLASTETLLELMETLWSSKFDPYVTRNDREMLIQRLAPLVEIIEIVQTIQARDSRDDKLLEVAVNGRASVLVTGDRDLLSLHPFRGVAILTPAVYLERASRREP